MRQLMAALVIVCASATLAQAQETVITSYGFGSTLYTYDDSVTLGLHRAVGGMKVRRGVFGAEIQLNLVSMKASRALMSWSDSVGRATVSVTAGRQLSPVALLYTAPFLLRTPRWADAFDGYRVLMDGVSVQGGIGILSARVGYATNDTGEGISTAILTLSTTSFYIEEQGGYGLMVKAPWENRWVNPVVGVTRYAADDREWSGFLENSFRFGTVWIVGQVDFGDGSATMLSLSYEISPGWYVNISGDRRRDRDNRYNRLQMEGKFSF